MNIDFAYDAAGDITALNDNIRSERSQTFTYDAVSRLTSASGGYGDFAYSYNLGGDRTARTRITNDGGASVTDIEDYTYNAAFQLDNVSSSATGALRTFSYEASGQLSEDTRGGQILVNKHK